MNLNDKVNFIFDKFNDPKEFKKYGIEKKYKSKLWNMDTSILAILEQMKNKIIDIEYPIIELEVKLEGLNKKNNREYALYIGEKNITPSSTRLKVAFSTIRQYLQILSSLGIVMFTDESEKEILQKFKVSSNFKSSICDFEGPEIIKSWILFCLKRNIGYSRNLGYSIFIMIMHHYKYDFSNISIQNKMVEKRMGKDGFKFFNFLENYGEKYLEKCKKETYGKLIDKSISLESMDDFVNYIYSKLNSDSDSSDESLSHQILMNKYNNTLNKKRSYFKKNIKANRIELKVFDPMINVYSDIINLDNGVEGLGCKFNELNAAHIYNVWQIKREIKEIENNDETFKIDDVIEQVANPYNGLMMDSKYHDHFDRNLFTFDSNGEMIYRESDKDYIFNVLKLQEIKINPLIFNDEMKNFLSKRKF